MGGVIWSGGSGEKDGLKICIGSRSIKCLELSGRVDDGAFLRSVAATGKSAFLMSFSPTAFRGRDYGRCGKVTGGVNFFHRGRDDSSSPTEVGVTEALWTQAPSNLDLGVDIGAKL